MLELFDVYEWEGICVFVLSKDNNENVFKHIAASLETLRRDAITMQNKIQKNKL